MPAASSGHGVVHCTRRFAANFGHLTQYPGTEILSERSGELPLEKPISAYKGDQPYIFVCYAHEDSAIVYPEIQWLHEQGVKIWYDEGISAGRIWRKEIAEAIQGASKFLYYVSKAALASDHCNREVDYALDKAFDVVPVYLEETQLTPELDLALNRVQALHRKNDTSYQQHLLDAVGGVAVVEPQAVESKQKLTMPIFAGLAVLVAGLLTWAGVSFFSNKTDDTQIRSIAVLPLENISGDPDQEYLSDGTTDMLIQELSKIRSLRVTPRQSVLRYRKSEISPAEIAEQLNVDSLLTGTVIEIQGRIRFAVQLYDVASDRNVWTDLYDRDFADILTLQSDIARAVSEQINLELTSTELAALSTSHKVDGDSQRAFMRGSYHLSRMKVDSAMEELKRSVELDPLNADAYAELTRLVHIQMWFDRTPEKLLPVVRQYNERALALNPNHSHAHATNALLMFMVDHQYQQAIDSFSELLNTNPDDHFPILYYSFVLESIGRFELTLRLVNRMLEANPLNAQPYAQQGSVFVRLARYAEASASFDQSESLGYSVPKDRATLAFEQGDKETLALQLGRDVEQWLTESQWLPVMKAYFAYLSGDTSGLKALVQHEEEKNESTWVVRSHYQLLLGDADKALEYYSRALSNREATALVEILGSKGRRSEFPDFYKHPKYEEMLRANRLDSASIAKLTIPPFPF